MIVRTYGRRNRAISRTYSNATAFNDVVDVDVDVDVSFKDSLSQESPQDFLNIPFSSQDSSHWSFDSELFNSNPSQNSLFNNSQNGFVRKSKKAKNGKNSSRGVVRMNSVIPMPTNTTSLMEMQESGEMMEHVDEVNFALDGLKKGSQARIRRSSLLSLLSIAASVQQRRLLRTHGTDKTIIDAILNLSLDDSPSNLAAAALFYVLTTDGQDDHLLESPSSIRFLLNFLKPLISDVIQDKAPSIGSKLLSLRKDAGVLRATTKSLDSSSSAIALKVREILVSCKDLKSGIGNESGVERPELSPKWIALSAIEKACLTTFSLEDASGTVRKIGGNFKEKLREFGGLDTVFDIAMGCHSDMEGWLEHSSLEVQELKDDVDIGSLSLLLKCLKIMENATFMSKDNQSHLLQLKGNSNYQGSQLSIKKKKGSQLSFIRLIISIIQKLSSLSLLRSSATISSNKKACNLSQEIVCSELPVMAECKVDNDETFSTNSTKACFSTKKTSCEKSFSIAHNSQWLSTTRSEYPVSSYETTSTSGTDSCLLKMRVDSSRLDSCCGTSGNSNNISSVNKNASKKNSGIQRRPSIDDDTGFESLEDGQDPFAFDEDDFEPSKWDLLSGKRKVSRTRKHSEDCRELEDGDQLQLMMQQLESGSNDDQHSQNSCSASINEESSALIADCLLAAIKVLMNLTNDNPLGCQQIAAYGGLETLPSLIAGHFPSFTSSPSPPSKIKEDSLRCNSSSELDHKNDRHLDTDFLVAILGLLVNLVEKDGSNRSRLAAASVLLPSSEQKEEESCSGVIPLLCSIFLANQGAGEAAGEENFLQWNDEEAVLQQEREGEKTIIEAYAALLLAFLSTESKNIRDAIADCLPDHNLAILVPVLERFVEFHLTLNMMSPETHIAVSEVIESCRIK